ncbi:MAG: Txe/YoeB family addiction module toxin [Bifidobacteriaceae bacterium]|jgi:toxin YoeB|nr:Txe/YoeB family addiction module toxin [Bifidobacteriaceae bacterium]
MLKSWHETAWEDYLYWQSQDKRTLKKINALIKDIERNGRVTTGLPEFLSGDLAGWCSVRIDAKNRLVFAVDDGVLEIYQCRGHYGR